MKTETSAHLLILLVIAGSIFLTNLGKAKLWDRDEPRNAGCAAEMLARGDWVVPTFNAQLRQQKPVLQYWLMMSAYAVFGVSEFSARLWSALLGIGTVWVTYGIARRLFNSTLALLAGVILATSMMFDVASRAATPDSVLIFFSTLAILFYVLGTFDRRPSLNSPLRLKTEGCWFPQHWAWATCMYLSMGFGVLAKGLPGAVLPTAIIGMFLLIYRLPTFHSQTTFGTTMNGGETQSRMGWIWQTLVRCLRPFYPLHFAKTVWSMRPVTAIVLILAVAAPWYVMVGIQTDGEFTRRFFLDEHLGRATTAMENHRGGIWFYPLAILVGFFPWSVFWAPALIGIKEKFSGRGLLADHKADSDKPQSVAELKPVVFLICWVCVQVGIFSIARTKLPSYVTPCYPALAILTAALLYEFAVGTSRVPRFWFYGALVGMAIGGLMMALGLAYVTYTFLPAIGWIALAGLIPILGATVAWIFFRQLQPHKSIMALATSAFLLSWVTFGLGTVAVDSQRTANEVLTPVSALSDEVRLASFNVLESSWVYYAGRPIHELSEFDSANDPRSAESYFEKYPGALVLTTDEHVSALKKRLPRGYSLLRATDHFLKDNQILLFGPSESKVAVGPTPHLRR